jgi:hypothetical protein
MDLHKMIAELQAERQRLDHAIEALERLSLRTRPRRGRPPAWLKKEMDKLQSSAQEKEPEQRRA